MSHDDQPLIFDRYIGNRGLEIGVKKPKKIYDNK
jgi:hypothetical protein